MRDLTDLSQSKNIHLVLDANVIFDGVASEIC